MSDDTPIDRRAYELTAWRVAGPAEAIPLLLYHRLDLAGPKPAVVYYHGVTQSKDAYVDTHPLARRLTDAGFVVAIPDAPGHGERPSGATLIARLRESLPHEFCLDVEQAADESPTLLDWLASRLDVDGGRLGVVGVSMGGFTAAVVAARARDRLRAAVCVAGSADLPRCLAETDSIAPGKWGPPDRSLDGETRARIARIDPLGYPEQYAPLPLLVLHGDRDTWNPCATSERFAAAVQPGYAAHPEAFRLTIVPAAPHWPPNPTIVQEAVEWLRYHV